MGGADRLAKAVGASRYEQRWRAWHYAVITRILIAASRQNQLLLLFSDWFGTSLLSSIISTSLLS